MESMSDGIDARESVGGNAFQAILTIAVFISFAALGIAVLFVLSRLEFDLLLPGVLKTVFFFLFLVNTPFAAIMIWKYPRRTLSMGSYAAMLLCLVALSSIVGRMDGMEIGVEFQGWIIALAGGAAFLIMLFQWIKIISFKQGISFLGLSIFFAIWLAGRLWGPQILHPLYFEGLSTGKGFIDTLFHIDVSQMIHTYGVASTGVDGLAAMRYHTGSHWLIAQWASLLGLPVFAFFILAYSIIFMPLFYLSILLIAVRLSQAFGRPVDLNLSGAQGKMFWLLFFILTIRLLPDRALANLAVWETFTFSPSFFFGLIVLFLVTIICLDLWNLKKTGIQVILFCFVIPISLWAMGWMKNSIMVLAAALYGFILLRQGHLKRPLPWIGLLLAGIVTLKTMLDVTNFGAGGGFRLFAFLRDYVPLHLFPYHLFVYFGFLWIYSIIRFQQSTIRSWRALIHSNKMLDLEVLALLAFLGILPGLFLAIPNGSAQYFSDVHIRLAVPLILAQSGWLSGRISAVKNSFFHLVIFLILALLGWKSLCLTGFYIKENTALRTEIRGASESTLHQNRIGFLRKLQKLDRLPVSDKKRMLVHIFRSDTVFWHSFLNRESGQTISLLIPAVSGIAMLNGLPPDSVETAGYGFAYFSRRGKHPGTHDELCRAARSKGFENAEIVTFSSFGNNPIIIPCRKRISGPDSTSALF